MFSKACEHGIKAMIYIATQSIEKQRIKVVDIAKNTDSPEAFTAKVLSKLNKNGLVQSQTGPAGGFYITQKSAQNLKLSQIVIAIDGTGIFNNCALGLKHCNPENPCPLHHHFAKIRSELQQMLENTTLFELATQLQNGQTTLLR